MKGIIAAGGHGTRLQPATFAMNKHMIPIVNNPMILYPLYTLKNLGITDIMIVTGGNHIGGFAEFLKSGKEYGVNIVYGVQEEAGGIAQAIGVAEGWANGDEVTVVLGDNIFSNLCAFNTIPDGNARLLLSRVKDPQRFGVAELDRFGNLIGIEEKPTKPKSRYAITGLYMYPNNVFDIIKTLKPSGRGELEISDVNNWYVKNNRCSHSFHSDFWKDAGTPESLKEVVDWAWKEKPLTF